MTNILTPVGRLVRGSLYEPQTKDMAGNPLVIKKGPDIGKPTVKYWFELAIPKNGEAHWNQTAWGKLIWDEGVQAFPGGQTQSPIFAWKVSDGDSTIPNSKGTIPVSIQGHAKCWVLSLSSNFAPSIVKRDGSKAPELEIKDAIKLGYYVAIYASVVGNDELQRPGVYLNHKIVSFQGYGEEIVLGVDPKTLGFDQLQLPAGAQQTPVNTQFSPTTTPVAPTQYPSNTISPQTPPIYVTPHTGILSPPPATPVVPLERKRIMTSAAEGTYEQYIAANWTDQQLIQHGIMQP